MDHLRALRAFLAVVERGGFAAAARSLGLSTSAVSRHVAELEAFYGTQLLNRTTRRCLPTEAGSRLGARAGALVDELDGLRDEIATLTAQPRGHLRLSAPPGFGGAEIAPRLPALMQRHPELSIELDLSVRFVDLIGEGYDAAIRAGPLPDSDLACRKLAELPRTLCAAPGLAAQLASLEQPRQLSQVECLAWRGPAAPTYWGFRDEAGARFEVPVYGRFATTTSAAEREAARAGLGVGLFNEDFVADDLAEGRLVRLLPRARPEPLEIFLVWPPQKLLSAKLRVLIDHLSEALRCPLPDGS